MKKIITALALAAALALTGCSAATEAVDAGKAASAETKAAAPAAEEKKEADVPSEYKSALKSAENYNKIMPMSKAGLLAQLSSAAGDKF